MRFFKIIDERVMEEKKLRMPKLFLRAFGNQLSDLARVSVSDGRVWLIELTKNRKDMWFHDGLHEFFDHYSIREGHLLIFSWKGDSAFDLLIFYASACEIQYSAFVDSEELGHHGEIEEPDSVEILGDVESVTTLGDVEPDCETDESNSSYVLEADKKKKLGKRKASGNSKRAKESCSRKKAKGNAADDVILVNAGEENGVTTQTPGSKVARLSQCSMRKKYPGYRPKNAYFVFLLREYKTRRMGYIPMGFAKHNLDRSLTSIRVVDGNKEWTLGILWRMMNQNKAKDVYIYKGWEEFLQENELKVGDVLGFELIRKEPEVTLKFTKVHTD